MSVRKRSWKTSAGEIKEAWIADYVDGAGKRHLRTFDKKKNADAFAAKTKIDVSAGTHVQVDPNQTINDIADQWLDDVRARGLEETTRRMYEMHCRAHILPRIGSLKLSKLTADHVRGLRKGILQGERKLALPTAAKVWTSFLSMLKHARIKHLADGVTITNTDRRRIEAGTDFPTPDEMRRILAAADDVKIATLLRTAAATGLRACELTGLRWTDVNLKAHKIHVRQRADRFGTIGAPKSLAGTRTIPIGPDLAHRLKAWKLACPIGEGDLVFPNENGGVWLYENLRRNVDRIMLKAHAVDRQGRAKYALHAFRHFYASWCINAKEDGGRQLTPKQAQVLLGHSSIKMTLDRYGHLFPGDGDATEVAASEKAMFG